MESAAAGVGETCGRGCCAIAEGMSEALPAAKYSAPPIKTAALTYKAMASERFRTFLAFCQNGG